MCNGENAILPVSFSCTNAFSLTMQECVNKLEIAGDKCSILAGRYHEEVKVDGKFASDENPFIIEGRLTFGDRDGVS